MPGPLVRRAVAELVGTAMLLVAVIGSGIAASRLSPQDTGLQLFENAVATGAALVAIILAVGPVSGAHLNPLITAIDRLYGGLSTAAACVYVLAQLAGAALGAMIANLMFGLSAVQLSEQARTGWGLWFGEFVATLGLALVVFGVVRSGRAAAAPFAVGAFITGAYFCTSSTSFANPAATLGRTLSNTFAGIKPSSAPAFIAFEILGAAAAAALIWVIYPDVRDVAGRVVVPHDEPAAEASAEGASA